MNDLAAVVPYRDGTEELPQFSKGDDIESNDLKKRHSNGGSSSLPDLANGGLAPPISPDTPFFHIDLAAAVRAAESGLHRVL